MRKVQNGVYEMMQGGVGRCESGQVFGGSEMRAFGVHLPDCVVTSNYMK